MPDWTYQPLRGIAAALLGTRRSRLAALRVLAAVGSLPGGGRLITRALGHRHRADPVSSRLGAVVPPSVASDAVRALPPLGAALIEIAPVGPADVPAVRAAAVHARRQRVPLSVHAAGEHAPAVARALSPHVDTVRIGTDPAVVHVTSPSVALAAGALTNPGTTVLATPQVLIRAGPGWFARVQEAVTATSGPPPALRDVGLDPRRWPTWWWALLVGLGMIVAGLGAATITLGPVLLSYDRDLIGLDVDHLHAANHRLVPFLRHDRITMAGAMIATGVLYAGLAIGGIRRGWPWAREAFLVSGWLGFATLLYLLGFGFVEPLHAAVTAALFPMFLLGTRRRPQRPLWTSQPEGPERERRRALTGQLLLVCTGLGLFASGAAISAIGLTDVFVASDLAFLRAAPDQLSGASPRLLPFIAHDRAGFGGTLLSAASAITLLSAWGFRRGEAWVWWTLALAAVAGFAPTLAVHCAIGYLDALHLAPVVIGLGLTALGLALARPYLCAPLP